MPPDPAGPVPDTSVDSGPDATVDTARTPRPADQVADTSAAKTVPAPDSRTTAQSPGDSAAPPPKPRAPRPKAQSVAKPQAGAGVTGTPAVPPVGFVTINAVPYGTVAVDGVEIGDTPIVRRQLPPGEHEVRITRPGYRPQTFKITVTGGNELRLSRSLIRDSL
jgi:hypothetical protein